MQMILKNKRTQGKIKAHYGIKDYFNFFKSDNPDILITKKKYSDIISEFNKEIINLIIEDNLKYDIPFLGSSIVVKQDKRLPKIIDGKLYNTTPVDWAATNKLWSEDEESKERKLLVRYSNAHTSKNVFRIYFKKYNIPFMNKKLYLFKSARSFSRLLGDRINDEEKDKYNAYTLY
jgi:hypothetical protein